MKHKSRGLALIFLLLSLGLLASSIDIGSLIPTILSLTLGLSGIIFSSLWLIGYDLGRKGAYFLLLLGITILILQNLFGLFYAPQPKEEFIPQHHIR